MLFYLIPSKAGRRMRVDWQRLFRQAPESRGLSPVPSFGSGKSQPHEAYPGPWTGQREIGAHKRWGRVNELLTSSAKQVFYV